MVKIHFGIRYTCDGWEDLNGVGVLAFIPDKVEGNMVGGVGIGHNLTSYPLSSFGFGDRWKLRPVSKIVKATKLARKMYPEAEDLGEFLRVKV